MLCSPSFASMEQFCDCWVFSCLSKQGNYQRQGMGRFQPGNHDGLLYPREDGSQGSPSRGARHRPSPPAPGGPSPVPGLGDEPAAGLHLHIQAPLHAAHLHVLMQVAVHVVLGRGQLQLRGRAIRSATTPACTPRRLTRQAVKEVKGSGSKLNQLEAEGTGYAIVPSMFPGEARPQRLLLRSLMQETRVLWRDSQQEQ